VFSIERIAIMQSKATVRIVQVSLFAIAFAFVESAVVVYLRALYYPEGFSFPLRLLSPLHFTVELVREFSTIVMLGVVGMLAGSSRWQRFSYFMIAFGVWDLFYYVWLKAILQWPTTLLEPDILFLLPIPWIGPVIAPVAISLLMVVAGVLIIKKEEREGKFRPTLSIWVTSAVGTGILLFSLMRDTDAALQMHLPQLYHYELFIAGLLLYIIAIYRVYRTTNNDEESVGSKIHRTKNSI
jgi:hypothetical protein